MKAVFDIKPNSGYDDEIVWRYHFPTASHYMAAAEGALGDWIIYRETQRNRGRRAYVAAARVLRIEPDLALPGHAYAVVTEYLPFDTPVPFSGAPLGYWETPLLAITDRRKVGGQLQGKSVRSISDEDFSAIVLAGLSRTLDPEGAADLGLEPADELRRPADESPPGSEFVRRVEEILVSRKVRDASFRRQVREAYGGRCAVTGLKIIDGKGRTEAQGAHIWSVGAGGPDVVQNGVSLSATIHWLFDRHLISLTDDYRLLVDVAKVPAELLALFGQQMERIHLPSDERLWPHASYLARHRERFSAV